MRLSKLLFGIEELKISSNFNPQINDITDDSRKVQKGSVFVAIKGLHFDGEKFIDQAIENGAEAIVSEHPPKNTKHDKVVYIICKNVRKTLSLMASNFYANPARKLKIIGITGTKGKTTTACYLYDILTFSGIKCGLVSSVGTIINDKRFDTGLHVTNPEPMVLHKFLSEMVDNKCKYAILEVTSHGLHQERVAGIDFDISVLTNIRPEHLDYHKTMKNYKQAKLKLFLQSRISILNKNDSSCVFFENALKSNKKEVFIYSIEKESDYKAEIIKTGLTDSIIKINGEMYHTNITADYNISNLLSALSVIKKIDIKKELIRDAIIKIRPIEGRMEKIENNKNISIFIDFAHTPDSLEKVITNIKKEAKGKLICVFGCAGERDRKKRQQMGRISAKNADITVITAEDPRSEDLISIINEIALGCKKNNAVEIKNKGQLSKVFKNNKHYYLKVPERESAIDIAINDLSKKHDTIIFCGKGHEKSMCFMGIEHPYSERNTIDTALKIKSDIYCIIFSDQNKETEKQYIPKILFNLAGRPLISYLIKLNFDIRTNKTVIVIDSKSELAKKRLGSFYDYVIQKSLSDGNGKAIEEALHKFPNKGTVIIMNAESCTFYSTDTINLLISRHKSNDNFLTYTAIPAKNSVHISQIPKNKEIIKSKQINHSCFIIDIEWLRKNIKKSVSSGFNISDLISSTAIPKNKIESIRVPENQEIWIDNAEDLKSAEKIKRRILNEELGIK